MSDGLEALIEKHWYTGNSKEKFAEAIRAQFDLTPKPPVPSYRCSRELAEKLRSEISKSYQTGETNCHRAGLDAIERDWVRELAQRRAGRYTVLTLKHSVYGELGFTPEQIAAALCGDTP